MSFRSRFLVPSLTGAVVAALVAGCGSASPGTEPEAVSTTAAALSADGGADAAASITISGTVTDPIDGPQAGITITLSGSANAKVVTGWDGSFKFPVAPGGSYSITAAGDPNYFQPPFHSCLTVTPSIVNLNNLTQSVVIPMVGSGTDSFLNCSPAASNGASSGSLKISGTVTSGGLPVAGARVFLNGSTQGYRTTDETGAYTFSVNPGSYSVQPEGTCGSFSPSVVNLNNLKASAVENFTGASCPPAPLTLCPTFDTGYGLTEPSSCNTASSPQCAGDRLNTWAGEMVFDFQFLETDTLGLNDCRFGLWQQPPIVNDLTALGELEQQNVALNLFILQLFGCQQTGDLTGPLNLQGTLIPPDLIKAGLTFTTADISALEDEFMAGISQGLADFGMPALTAAQTTAIRAQLDSAAKRVPGVISSSKLSYSTCP